MSYITSIEIVSHISIIIFFSFSSFNSQIYSTFKYKSIYLIPYCIYISSSDTRFTRKEEAIFNDAFDLLFEPPTFYTCPNPPNILRWIFRNITGYDVTASRQQRLAPHRTNTRD